MGEDVNHRHFIALISEKLPQRVLYQLYMLKAEDEEWTVSKLRQLLGKHITALEMASLEFLLTPTESKHHSSLSQNDNTRRNHFSSKPTASGLLAGSTKQRRPKQIQAKCIFCSQPHWSDECSNCKTLHERREKLKGSCYICLKKGHLSKNCAKEKICAHCGKKNDHHRSLCPTLFPNSDSSGLSSIEDTVEAKLNEVTKTNVLMQTATTTVKNVQGSSSMPVRLILDSGSQRTYVTEKLAKEIKLNLGPPESLSIATFGANQSTKLQCKSSKLQLHLKDRSVMSLDVTVVPSITGRITRTPLSQADAKFLRDSALEDKLADTIVTSAEVFQVDMLVGNDYYFDLLQPRKIDLGNGLYLFQSKLGWVFGGKVESKTEVVSEQNLLVSTMGVAPTNVDTSTHNMLTSVESSITAKPNLELFWNLESLGITESPLTCDDDLALDHFNKTVKFEEGRYMVTWPWKEENPNLPSNYYLALGRLKSILQKLHKHPQLLQQYDAIIQEQLQRGIIEKIVTESEEGPIKHYIPHHPVITPLKSTTKVRVVYDASAKTKQDHKSLNENLYRGPIILPDLIGLLLRFRLPPIGVISDIEKAFLNVGLQAKDRDVTRFLWLNNTGSNLINDENLQVYRFCRIPFGIISSPFLLSATINYHLKQIGSTTAEQLQRDIYVDNLITGAQSVSEGHQLYTEAKQIFTTASMNLREWASNSEELMALIPNHDRANSSA